MFPATVLDWLIHNLVWNKTNLIKIPVPSTVAGLTTQTHYFNNTVAH